MATIKTITGVSEFKKVHADNPKKVVVVDFTATWCGPCRMMSPIFDELAKEYNGQAVFCKCDVDVARDVAQQEKISAMPTFKFYVDGKEVATMTGADPAKLKEHVKTLVGKHSVFSSSKGYSLVSGSSASSSNQKSADKVQPKRFNPWADPNFFPRRTQADSSTPAATEAKPATSPHQPNRTKTPWSDPSFMPKATETTPSPPTSKPAQKPAETEADADLAKAIALSLDTEEQSGSATKAENDPKLTSSINQELLDQLLDMGFPRIRAEKALILTKAKTMEAATNWLIEHDQDADIDEPLSVVGTAAPKDDEMFDDEEDGLSEAIRSVREKAAKAKEEARKQALGDQESVDMSKMTKEEKLAYIERLKAARKAQREKEAREEAKQKEIQRQQNVKAALEAKRAREEQQAAMAAARAKREKEAERERQKRIEDKLKADKEARMKAKLEREQKKAPGAI